MAGDEQKVATPRREAPIASFTVEFGDSKNSSAFVIGCLSRLEVRGKWKRDQVPAMSLGERMSQMPDIPGQQMTVYPRERRAVLTDPLATDPDLVRKANGVLAGGQLLRTEGGSMQPHPEMKIPLVDDDQVKTLVLTLCRWVECGNCVVVKGKLPTPEEVEQAPGKELYDPANTNVHGHPRYVDQVDAWRQRIEMGGAV